MIKKNLYFYFHDFNDFHKDGFKLNICIDGEVRADKWVHIEGQVLKMSFEFDLNKKRFGELKDSLSVYTKSVELNERQGIPGESMANYGFKKTDAEWIEFSIWSGDKLKQPDHSQKIISIFEDIATEVYSRKENSIKRVELHD